MVAPAKPTTPATLFEAASGEDISDAEVGTAMYEGTAMEVGPTEDDG
jgi:hypothetical protein